MALLKTSTWCKSSCWGMPFLFLLLVGITESAVSDTKGGDSKAVVCYYTPTARFPPARVPGDACTHIIYAFGSISTRGHGPNITAPSRGQRSAWTALTALKGKNPGLKVMLSLQEGFLDVIGPDTLKMQQFAANSVNYLRSYKFDGVDMDWEYPKSSQKDFYTKFFTVMRTAIDKEARASKQTALLLSLTLPNNVAVAQSSYDVTNIASSVDFATAMAYDFHVYNKADNTTGYNSPLFTPARDYKYDSASGLVKYYLSRGMPRSKLLMGIPTYGRSWTLASAGQHDLGSPAVGKGPPAPVSHLTGVYLYVDACSALQTGAVSVRSSVLGAVYLYKDSTWVAYDDTVTVAAKCTWAAQEDLGGVGVWAMHLDDVDGACGQGTLPLITTMKKIIMAKRP